MPRTTIRSEDITDAQIKTADMAVDPTNASNLSSGSVPSAQLGNVDTAGLEADIALLAFKTQANGNLAKYNLVDQVVDAFEDATGVDASSSTNEFRNAAGNYYSGSDVATDVASNHTTVGSDTWTSPSNLTGTVKILVVAGGGGAGKSGWTPGAGGAGGLVYVSNYAAAASTSYGVTVGAGGAEQTTAETVGNNGADSVFDTAGVHQILTASGGGGGGRTTSAAAASAGGSGGGGAADNGGYTGGGATDQVVTFGSYSNVGFGFAGGVGYTNYQSSGGGGGAGSVGEANQGTARSGNGGSGKDYSAIFGAGVGDSGWFAGGGGGGSHSVAPHPAPGAAGYGNGGNGNYGGGGDGAANSGPLGSGDAGAANTGGGAGGGNHDETGAAGGSGAVHILYDTLSYADMTLVSNTTTAQAAPTKGDLVFTYTNGAGTAVLGTNITAEASMDNGSTWTDFGIAAGDVQGTTGGHTIVAKNNVTLTSTSGTNMRYRIKTLVQSASLDTRIHAVSLGWS